MGKRDRGQLRRVQNLIRICVADATQNARVGQSSLEGSIFDRERLAKSLEVAGEDVDAPGVDGSQRLLTLEKIKDARRLVPASVSTSEP